MVVASDWPLNAKGDRVDTRYRDLARNLGGCPENLAGGRFKTISTLTTSMQKSLVAQLCVPRDNDDNGAALEALLPPEVPANLALSPDVAAGLLTHQSELFLAREPSLTERQEVAAAADACAPKPCTAADFARPLCYALLSGAEMLFYPLGRLT
ncbi:MAG: hypothetical protein ACI9MR_003660 [Myxococcota bacterium]|jgi:hypothetical protein